MIFGTPFDDGILGGGFLSRDSFSMHVEYVAEPDT